MNAARVAVKQPEREEGVHLSASAAHALAVEFLREGVRGYDHPETVGLLKMIRSSMTDAEACACTRDVFKPDKHGNKLSHYRVNDAVMFLIQDGVGTRDLPSIRATIASWDIPHSEDNAKVTDGWLYQQIAPVLCGGKPSYLNGDRSAVLHTDQISTWASHLASWHTEGLIGNTELARSAVMLLHHGYYNVRAQQIAEMVSRPGFTQGMSEVLGEFPPHFSEALNNSELPSFPISDAAASAALAAGHQCVPSQDQLSSFHERLPGGLSTSIRDRVLAMDVPDRLPFIAKTLGLQPEPAAQTISVAQARGLHLMHWVSTQAADHPATAEFWTTWTPGLRSLHSPSSSPSTRRSHEEENGIHIMQNALLRWSRDPSATAGIPLSRSNGELIHALCTNDNTDVLRLATSAPGLTDDRILRLETRGALVWTASEEDAKGVTRSVRKSTALPADRRTAAWAQMAPEQRQQPTCVSYALKHELPITTEELALAALRGSGSLGKQCLEHIAGRCSLNPISDTTQRMLTNRDVESILLGGAKAAQDEMCGYFCAVGGAAHAEAVVHCLRELPGASANAAYVARALEMLNNPEVVLKKVSAKTKR